jgi:hypothetical protein
MVEGNPMPPITPITPILPTDSLKSLTSKTVLPLPENIGTAAIQTLEPEIRERAFFSARTPYAGYLADIQRNLQNLIQPEAKITPEGMIPTVSGESLSPAQVRAKMKQQLAALNYQPDPEKRGGLQDLSTDLRTNLIIKTQLQMARGYGSWRESQNPEILDAFPADELYRALDRKIPRDWQQRWNEARAKLGAATTATKAYDKETGPFIALKNDPIWTQISIFGNPYPPFDFGSGRRVRDIDRQTALDMKVLAPDQVVQPQETTLNQEIEMPTGNIPAPLLQALAESLGNIATIIGDVLRITPSTGGIP